MWETAEKAGIITANLMWPGPPRTMSGASSTYFEPWRDKVPLDEKLSQIMHWLDLPLDERPQLIMAYEPSLDQAGHRTGPNSKATNQALVYVDTFAKHLHDSLAERNLSSIVDIIFVSDHGMTDTSHPISVYMDDILGEDGLAAIEHEDGWPAMGIRFAPNADAASLLEKLQRASEELNYDYAGDKGKGHEGGRTGKKPIGRKRFSVYTADTMPERWHFNPNHNGRIAPVYVVPEKEYILTTRAEGDVGMSKGVSDFTCQRTSLGHSAEENSSTEPWIRQQGAFDARHVRCPWSLFTRCQGHGDPATQAQGWLAFDGRGR